MCSRPANLQTGIFKKACDHSNKLAIESIKSLKPTLVVIAQANGHNKQDWLEINNALLSMGVSKLILVGPVSQWKPSLPMVMIKPKNWNSNSDMISDSGLDLEIINIDKEMISLSELGNYEYISLISNLCEKDDTGEQYLCRVWTNERELLQVDYGHLSKAGSLFVTNEILAERMLDLYNSNFTNGSNHKIATNISY